MIVSYKDRDEDRQRGLEAGAAYYLTKGSFHDETLLQAVVDLIGEAGRVRIGIVNDLPATPRLLRRAVALSRSIRSSGSRRAAPKRWSCCAKDDAGPDPDGPAHAGHGRRRSHAADHGQHAVRDPDRDRQRAASTPRGLRGDGPRRARRGRHARARTAVREQSRAPLLAKIATISRLIGEKDAARRAATPATAPSRGAASDRWSRSAPRRAARPRWRRSCAACRRTFRPRSSSFSTSTSSSPPAWRTG